jgi:hypothetical protein
MGSADGLQIAIPDPFHNAVARHNTYQDKASGSVAEIGAA